MNFRKGATKMYSSLQKYSSSKYPGKKVSSKLSPGQYKFGKGLAKTVDNAVDVHNRRV